MGHQNHLGEESIGKLLLKYSIPAIIGMMVNALYNIVDRMFIGRIPEVGSLALTGVGITMPIMSILLAFGMLIGIGSTANISLNLGRGKRDDAERLIGSAITLSLIVGVLLTFIGLIFINPILNLFGASSNTLIYAKQYITIILFGCTFNILSFALNSTVRADGSPKMASFTMIIGCLTNVVLDYVFVFVLNMGIKGAAFATVISQALTFFIILYYYTKGKSNLKLKIENMKLKKSLVLMTFAIGIAPFATQIANSLVQVVANNSLKAYGNDLSIGAMTIIGSINMVFMMPIFGIRADGNPKLASITMVIGCGTNIVLDYLFVFVLNMGIRGAAFATVISQALTFIIILYYYTKGNSNLKLKIKNMKLNKNLVMMTFAIGIAPFATQIANSLVQVVANNSLKAYGNDLSIGAMTIIGSINMVFMMPIFGINQGCQPIIGFNYGAKKYDRAKRTFIIATIAATVICIFGGILIQAFPQFAISLFNNDPELTAVAVKGVRIYLLMMPIVGVNIVATSYFQSVGKAKMSMFVSLLRQVILLIPFTLILPLFIGLDGVWAAGACADFFSVVITLVLIFREFKSLNKLHQAQVA